MAFEGLQLFWKQILLGCYAAFAFLRGALMLLQPRMVLGIIRRTSKRFVEACFRLVGRTMPRVDHEHQVLIVRAMGAMSLVGASLLIWWLLKR